MSLVRYAGPVAALRGVVGRLLPDKRVALRGHVRDVPPAMLERPRYWCLADGAWSGPHASWDEACAWLASLLRIWGRDADAAAVESAEASELGLTLHVDGCRVRIVPGGDRRPI